MALDQMTVLEKRVSQLLQLVKRLKLDNSTLKKQVAMIGRKLAKKERDSVRWDHDRVRLRSKVEKMLSEVGMLSGRSDLQGPSAVQQRKRGEA